MGRIPHDDLTHGATADVKYAVNCQSGCVSGDQSRLPGPQSGGDGLHHDDPASGGTD